MSKNPHEQNFKEKPTFPPPFLLTNSNIPSRNPPHFKPFLTHPKSFQMVPNLLSTNQILRKHSGILKKDGKRSKNQK